MWREEKSRKLARLRQQRFRDNAKSNASHNADVIVASSTSSSKEEIIVGKKRSLRTKKNVPRGEDFWPYFLQKARSFVKENEQDLRAAYPAVDFETEIAKAIAWMKAEPKTRRRPGVTRFIGDWFARAQNRGGMQQFNVPPKKEPLNLWGDTKPEPNP